MPPQPRLIAIGDIHGCLAPLKQLIEKLRPTPHDTLVFLGDYIDRGPDSKGVIEYLLRLRDEYNAVFLLGNHEMMLLDYLAFGYTESWDRNGGAATLDSYVCGGNIEVPASHAEFLKNCLPTYDTPDFFFVHGGLKPTRTIEENLKRMTTFDLVWEREHLEPKHLLSEDYAWEKTVVCGHTPQPAPIVLEKLICIDTGCVYNLERRLGTLTAICLPDRALIQISNRAQTRSLISWM